MSVYRAISVPTRFGSESAEVLAEFGPFAIHAAIWPRVSGAFAVTHVPTRHAISSRLPSVESALAFAREIEPLGDWTFTDPAAVKHWPKARVKRINDVLLKYVPKDDA